MKKEKLIVGALMLAAICLSLASRAQDVKGKNYVNAGIGIGTFGLYGSGGVPVTISAEHGFTDQISAGLYLGIVSRKYASDWKYNYKVIGVRGSYHLNEALKISSSKADVYGGLSIYHRSYTLKYDGIGGKEKVTDGVLGVGIFAGGRYFFAPNVGAFAELGYGISPLQLGLTVKF